MRTRVFTLRFSPDTGFDDSPLRDLQREHDVVALREYFFQSHDTPHLACVVTFRRAADAAGAATPGQPAAAAAECTPAPPPAPQSGKGRPAAALDPGQRAVFDRLRGWRAKTARDEGVPPYVVLTDRQLVDLILARPASRRALGRAAASGAEAAPAAP